MEKLETILKKRQVAGRRIPCPFCKDENAVILLSERRYKVFCPTCQIETFLKTASDAFKGAGSENNENAEL